MKQQQTAKTRVLWLTGIGEFPARSGGSMYSQGVTTMLANSERIEIQVALRPTTGPMPDHFNVSTSPVLQRIRHLFSMGPLVSRREALLGGCGDIDAAIEQFRPDVIVLDHLRNSYALANTGHYPLVYASQNVEADVVAQDVQESTGLAKLKRRLDLTLTRRAERTVLKRAQLVVAITAEDAQRFDELGARETLVVPPTLEVLGRTGQPLLHDDRCNVAVVAGTFNWHVKRDNIQLFVSAFAEATNQNNRLRVAGAMQPDLAQLLTQRGSQIEVRPNPEHMLPQLADCRIGVVPEFVGGGFKLKWLDYALAGLCPAGAADSLRGLPPKAKDAVVTATDPATLATRVVELLDQPNECRERAQVFQDSVLAHFQDSQPIADLVSRLAAQIESPRKSEV